MMCMQLSVTYCVICLDLRNPILQGLAMKLPGQWFIFLHNICFTFLVSLNVCRWLFACTCFSPRLLPPFLPSSRELCSLEERDHFSPEQNRSFRGGKHRTKTKCGLCGVCFLWAPPAPGKLSRGGPREALATSGTQP